MLVQAVLLDVQGTEGVGDVQPGEVLQPGLLEMRYQPALASLCGFVQP